ncbi:hypothetical protein D3C76_991590 [compost metagenome]
MGFVLDEGHAGGHQAPGEHDAGQPDARADSLQEDVGRDFEQRIADEEQAGTKAIGRGTDAQVVLHMGTHEADVHTVDVIDDKHDDEQRQDVALDLGNGRQQHRIRSGIRLEAGCVHWFFSHSLFLCGASCRCRC